MKRMYLENFGDRLAASLGGRGRVVFEVSEERGMGTSPTFVVRVYQWAGKNQAPRSLGQMAFALHPDRRAEIQSFTIEDWDVKRLYGPRLLRWFLWFAKSKKRATVANGNIFGTDMHTSEKLEVFRTHGFDIREMGSMSGHLEYAIERKL